MSHAESPAPESEERTGEVLRRLVDAAEAEAAEREVEAPVRRSALLVGAAGGALDVGAAGEIEAARGGGSALPDPVRRRMEAGFGGSLGAVRVHTDERAAKLSRAMSAHAFTTGRDIFFAPGQYAPDTPAGERILAHELAHTRQDDASAHRAMADAPVRRKMRGTADALVSQGGGETTGKFRKFFGQKTNWDQLVAGVKQYEALEEGLLAGGENPGPAALAFTKPKMIKLLATIQSVIAKWKTANTSEKETAALAEAEDWHQRDLMGEEVRSNRGRPLAKGIFGAERDVRAKADRWQAVTQLEPRVGNEIALLGASNPRPWLSSLGLTDRQKTGEGVTDHGAVNTVKAQSYQVEGDQQFEGYFKAETGLIPQALHSNLEHQARSGIHQHDPQFGARAMAMYRLDQLFDAGVTARVEFAVSKDPKTNKTVMGTVLEQAKGKQGSKTTLVHSGADARLAGDGAINGNDPAFQRALNKLQLLDAIAGQLDRHMGNVFIEANPDGSLKSLTGIDLDMSFGRDRDNPDAPGGMHTLGLPPSFDRQFAEKILRITAGDITAALTGLLPEAEIDATRKRLSYVQDKLRDAQENGQLVEHWDQSRQDFEENTAPGGWLPGVDTITGHNDRTYLQRLQGNFTRAVDAQMTKMLNRSCDGHEVPDKWREPLTAQMKRSRAAENMRIHALNHRMSLADIEELVSAFIDAIFTGDPMERLLATHTEGTPVPTFTPLEEKAKRAVDRYMADAYPAPRPGRRS
ncbi:MAG: DUF4157 domain-containing protein [Actinomycetia bacterium]|nr:DUF4157 domain-containing protein [Actinomycetes bacterium]